MPAVLFGSISTVADTSELQRRAFNEAFAEHGLDWTWDREDYLSMLESNGGQDRVAAYAESRGEQVDAAAVHRTKSEIFRRHLATEGVTPRPGVAETIESARQEGMRVGLVTTTSPENVQALGDALRPGLDLSTFDLVVDSSQVEESKPHPAAYAFALERLGESPQDCVAVEDNVGGVQSAAAAGVGVVAFPNENTAGHSFGEAAGTVDRLSLADLRRLVAGA